MNSGDDKQIETAEQLEEKLNDQSWFENHFEKALWNCRFVVLLAVVFGLISAFALFILGAFEVVSGIKYFYQSSPAGIYEGTALVTSVDVEGAEGAAETIVAASDSAGKPEVGTKKVERGAKLVGTLIGAVDYFLIGVVLLIFAFGIYELFVSPLEIGRLNKDVQILEITNLDDLKNRIIKVVIMVLIVSFFKKILSIEFTTPQDMFFFASSIFVICLGVYFLHKGH